jgi:hypothetical protein
MYIRLNNVFSPYATAARRDRSMSGSSRKPFSLLLQRKRALSRRWSENWRLIEVYRLNMEELGLK